MKGKIFCKEIELQLTGTLNGGQSFRWEKLERDDKEMWIGVFGERLWILYQDGDEINYEVIERGSSAASAKKVKTDYDELLMQYFQLDYKLTDLYKTWSAGDKYFATASKKFYGIRILRQEPVENIFSFICSANNNIKRITGMVNKLATFYGDKICTYNGKDYYTFPSAKRLSDSSVEHKLRENGFGYRAKYIQKSAQIIDNIGEKVWIESVRKLDYAEARTELMKLTGVGAKVADCICLMSLGHLESVPIDTHIYQIAARLYLPKLPKKSNLSAITYKEIGDHFRKLYGPLAGWAHTVLFCYDLKQFKEKT